MPDYGAAPAGIRIPLRFCPVLSGMGGHSSIRLPVHAGMSTRNFWFWRGRETR